MGQRIHDTPHIIDGVDINEIPTPEPNKPIPFTHPIYRKLYPHTKTMSDLEKGQLLYTPEQYTLAVTTQPSTSPAYHHTAAGKSSTPTAPDENTPTPHPTKPPVTLTTFIWGTSPQT